MAYQHLWFVEHTTLHSIPSSTSIDTVENKCPSTIYLLWWQLSIHARYHSINESFLHLWSHLIVHITSILNSSSYILSIKVLQGIMKSRDPVEVKEFTLYHNTILVFFSAVLTLGISSVVFPYMYHHGIMNSLCNPGRSFQIISISQIDLHSNSFLQLMYYLNYLLKFYEHLDTYVLILKKKRVIFLHWYHHASTFLLLVTHISNSHCTTDLHSVEHINNSSMGSNSLQCDCIVFVHTPPHRSMYWCIPTICYPPYNTRFGGRNVSPRYKSFNSSSTS